MIELLDNTWVNKIAHTCSKIECPGSACDGYDVMQVGLHYIHAEGGLSSWERNVAEIVHSHQAWEHWLSLLSLPAAGGGGRGGDGPRRGRGPAEGTVEELSGMSHCKETATPL